MTTDRARRAELLCASPMLALVVVLLGVPLVLLVTYAFRETSFAGVGPGPTLDQFVEVLRSDGFRRLAIRTALLGLSIATLVTCVAFVVAFAATFRMSRRTAFVALGVVLAAGIASLIVRIYAWGTILGTGGLINTALQELGVISEPLSTLYLGYVAVFVTMSYVYLPIAILLVYASMQGIDPRSLEASRDLGAGRWQTIARVVLPQCRNGMLSAFGLVLVLVCGDYVTPAIVGGTQGQTIGTMIQGLALESFNLPGAAALTATFIASFAVAVLVAVLLWWAIRALGRRLSERLTIPWTPGSDRLARVSLSRPIAALIVVFLVTPTLVVVVFAFNSSPAVGLPWKGFTTSWFGDVVGRPGFPAAIGNSLAILVVALVGGIAVGVPYAFALARASGRLRAILAVVPMLPFVVPGVLIGLGLLTVTANLGLRLGVAFTALAHILLVAPVVALIVSARVHSLNPDLVPAARDLGSSSARSLRTITAPLIFPQLIAATMIGAAISLDEIFMTSFTIGNDATLPIWMLAQARTGFDPGLNALGLMLVGATVVLAAGAGLATRGQRRRRVVA